MKIIILKIICYFLLIIISLLSIKNVYAINVTNIEINPSSPVYNHEFDCVISVSPDESNLACGLQNISDPLTETPRDICPKIKDLGHRSTENGKRFYRCIANKSTGVDSPGQYRIVAWYFWNDGAEGEAALSKNITIVNTPPPTATPYPTPTFYPTVPPSIFPTQANNYQQPTRPAMTIPTINRFTAPTIIPTGISSPSSSIPSISFNPIGELITGIFQPVVKDISLFTTHTQYLGENSIDRIKAIFINFMTEAAF